MPIEEVDGTQQMPVQQGTSSSSGVYITWTDLCATVSDPKNGSKQILQGLAGFAKPGEVLAIMGPSGCGKSTLLDALAGRLSTSTRRRGEILINGRKQQLAYGTSAYVMQDDILPWTLTVKEIVYYSAQLQLPNSISQSEKRERAERTIREMGLHDSINTRVGGWGQKGLSGGQKRRVSICVDILTRPKLLFLDEPTTGLDSAASYHVMSRIVKLARQDKMTVVASVHQPSSEVFGLFSKLCLLSMGRTVFFGSCDEAKGLFARNGFPCPILQSPADHYLRTINSDFDEDIEQGFNAKMTTEEVIDVLVKSYESSDTCDQIGRQIDEICKNVNSKDLKSPQSQEQPVVDKKRTQASFLTQCYVLTKRSFLNMYRDPGYYWVRLLMYIILGLGVGSVFYDLGPGYGSIHERGSMLMFVASFLTIMAIGGFPSFVEEMKVFNRERSNGHYGVGAFIVANTLSSTLYLLLISLIPGAITYYLVGLHGGSGRFIYYILVLFACMLLVESLMMIVASLVPNFLMGLIVGAGTQGLMMLSGGFFRLPNDLPNVFWKYPLYYISFHKYAYQGLYKNEFQGSRFHRPYALHGRHVIHGDEILREVFQVEMGYSKWVDLAVLFGMMVLYRFMFLSIIKIVEKFKPLVGNLLNVIRQRNEINCV